jgi:hypothetical protein
VVTHPFHPLTGQRLPILFERRQPEGRLYVCEGGPLGTLGLPETWTSLGPPRATRPLTGEVLAELAAVLADLQRR